MAIENENIRADMIEATEFPELSQRYEVYGVPLTVANEKVRFEGGAPEAYFIPTLLQELGIELPQGNEQNN
jgi:predicted DsbA family dithiol-disulfide isomerase